MNKLKTTRGESLIGRLTVEGKAYHKQDWMNEPVGFRAVFSDLDLSRLLTTAALMATTDFVQGVHILNPVSAELIWEKEDEDEVTENMIPLVAMVNAHSVKIKWVNRHNYDFSVISEDIPFRELGLLSSWEIKNPQSI